MLSSLSISNVALIHKCEINFANGFNVILGQSGAGKSIIIEALSFVLGAKADKTLIRSGENYMRVDAVFSDISPDTLLILQNNEIDCEDELIISRTLHVDGKSSLRINGCPVTVKTLKDVTCNIMDFCGQHDNVGLLNDANHLSLLDQFSGTQKLLENVENNFLQLQEIDRKIKDLGGNEVERNRLKDILSFQIKEIESAGIVEGEEEELLERFKFISSAENIFEKVSFALDCLESGCSATNLVFDAKGALSSFTDFEDINNCQERLENAYYELKDIAEVLSDIKKSTDFDEVELERIDKRLDEFKTLKKKYGKTMEEVLLFCEESKKKLQDLENSDALLEELNLQRNKILDNLLVSCENLSLERKKHAQILEAQIKNELQDLNMKGTDFKVVFGKGELGRKGYDLVKFAFSANQGQELKDLSKTASGGELSRLLLAFKNIMNENVSSVVFDEIDSGISGQVAGKVAEKLANISKSVQVICITHTPVVASKGDNFLLVEKHVENGNTYSCAQTITGDDVVYQIASLIDGSEHVSSTAIEHVKKLLNY